MKTEAELRKIFLANGMPPTMVDSWIDRLQKMKPADMEAWLGSYFQMISAEEKNKWMT